MVALKAHPPLTPHPSLTPHPLLTSSPSLTPHPFPIPKRRDPALALDVQGDAEAFRYAAASR